MASERGAEATAAGSGAERAESRKPEWERALLEELVYERARVAVDIAELLEIESQLAAGIERALASCGEGEDGEALVAAYIERAWSRIEREWRRARSYGEKEPSQCPVCGELTGAEL